MKTYTLISMFTLGATAAFCAETTECKANCEKSACCEQQQADNNPPCDEVYDLDMETITIEAANGDPIAQYTIAWLTDTGMNNVQQDSAKAEEMYAKALPGLEKAAADGDASACCALAKMYATGKGVKKDEAKAKEMMKRCRELMKEQKKDCATDTPAPAEAN